MVKKEIALSDDGNFVIEVPVAHSLTKEMPFNGNGPNGREFSHLRYTAVTTGPDEFSQQYSLRAKILGRRTKIAVVITMYNEEDVLFAKTFTAVMKNIAWLCSGSVAGWTKDGWKDIVVCIVSDGRSKCNPTTLNVMRVIGIYMDGLAKASVNGHDVKAHVFEFTNQITVTKELVIRQPTDSARDGLSLLPCQTIFLLKEKNAKKINSHRWFFKAVCDQLDPEVCILIDVGTKATKESFFHIYRAFENNPRVGGACGEITVELGKQWRKLINPIVAIQNFEYKMSNILDKPLESVFGYISVLPGAFSAYRYRALQGKPLECYFKGENPKDRDVREANMYLAEDRILCFELAMKESEPWLLKYVKSARAETDVPSTLSDLIKQRRRWLNGAFFVQLHATLNWMRISRSAHTAARKGLLYAEFLYNCITLLFSWFMIANMYLTFHVRRTLCRVSTDYLLQFLFDFSSTAETAACNGGAVETANDPFYPHGGTVFGVLTAVYLGSLIAIFIASMGNRPEAAKILYNSVAVIFALLMCMMLFMSGWTIARSITAYNNSDFNHRGVSGFSDYVRRTPAFRDMVVSTLSTFGLYLFSSLLHLDPWHVFTCILQYLLMVPTFVNIIMVYAFCNLHDVSWGTKGISTETDLKPVMAKTNEKGQQVVTVELPSDDGDADVLWEEHRKKLVNEASKLGERKDGGPTKTDDDDVEDFFKEFRTNTLLLWMFSNGLLVYLLTSNYIYKPTATGSSVNPYITFLLWSIAGLSLIRVLFSTIYLVGWWTDSLADAGKRNILSGIVEKSRQEAGV
ncbi:chitin synthase-domain-containing protein [Zopfochytrium polystomum]|nr:chitin synthase-domain-containing protein [Zopfochytrium polystomum]